MFRALPPFPTWSTAMIAALVGFGGTVPLIVEAMRALGASVEQTGSAVTALCLGIAVGGGMLSYRSRIPIVLAWSTPGAALLAVSMHGSLWPEAVGVFVSAALMMIAVGIVPALGKLAGHPGSGRHLFRLRGSGYAINRTPRSANGSETGSPRMVAGIRRRRSSLSLVNCLSRYGNT